MPEPTLIQRLAREKMLSRYLSALERGDIDTIIAILQQSARDAALEQMIFELHESYTTEEEFLSMIQEEPAMEFKEGIHKSRPAARELSEQPTLESQPEPPARRERSKYTRWLQALAAVLLICLLGGAFLLVQFLRAPHALVPVAAHGQGWCQIPVSGLNTNLGSSTFYGITGASASDIWMVGTLGGDTPSELAQTLVEHWNGSGLSVISSPNAGQNGDRLVAVTEVAPNNVWAVGSVLQPVEGYILQPASDLYGVHALIEHWDGHAWSIVPGPDGKGSANELESIVAVSANDIWAAGYSGQLPFPGTHNSPGENIGSFLVEHWDGHAWSMVSLPASLPQVGFGNINLVATPDGDVWIAGNTNHGSLLARRHNGQWSSTYEDGAYLYSLSSHATNALWVSGIERRPGSQTSYQTFIEHWNGTNWQKTILSSPSLHSSPDGQSSQYLSHLIAISASDAWAIGGQFGNYANETPEHLLLEHWDGRSWQSAPWAQKYNGTLSVLLAIDGRVWTAGTIYIGLQQIPSQIAETTC